jgi:hypothetical protein
MATGATAHLCHYRTKSVTDNTLVNEHGCVSIKLYLQTLKFEFHISILYVTKYTSLIFFPTT